jgi:serine/threonine protein phosphatase PrpC
MKVNTVFEKGTGSLNEDFHFIDGNLFGVFDGATSLSPRVYENGYTGGYLASNIAGDTFIKNNHTLHHLAINANMAIGDAMEKRGENLTDKRYLWSTSAAVIRLNKDDFEWIQIGDCLVLVIYEDGTHHILTDDFDHDLETLRLWKESGEKTTEPILSALRDQILKVRSRMNIDYGALNGEKEAISFLKSGSQKLKGIKHILLFTDGLFIPKQEPEERTDFDLFSKLFQMGGLEFIRDFVRDLEINDAGCRQYPRFKTHDDIAAISLTF